MVEERVGFVGKLKSINVPKTTTGLFLVCSLTLSASIFVRFFFTVDLNLRLSSIIAYVAIFFVLPIIAIGYITYELFKHHKLQFRRFWLGCSLFFLFFYCEVIVISVLSLSVSIYEHFYLWLPVPIMLYLFVKLNPNSRLLKKKYAVFVASGLAIAILLPNLTVAVSIYSLLNETSAIGNELEKANFISTRVEGMVHYGYAFRAFNDLNKFWLTGIGCCGEISMAKTNLMTSAGLEVRKVYISGENHEFVEVKIDGDWMVADGSELITRSELTANRIRGVGSLTYVVTLTEDSFIELTQMYVNNADTITIKVTRDGQPVSDAEVQLRHNFDMKSGSIMQQLPYSDGAFHTGNDGTVILHLGKPVYIGEYKKSEAYYWVFVNGQNCSRSVTSTGTDVIHPPLEIDID